MDRIPPNRTTILEATSKLFYYKSTQTHYFSKDRKLKYATDSSRWLANQVELSRTNNTKPRSNPRNRLARSSSRHMVSETLPRPTWLLNCSMPLLQRFYSTMLVEIPTLYKKKINYKFYHKFRAWLREICSTYKWSDGLQFFVGYHVWEDLQALFRERWKHSIEMTFVEVIGPFLDVDSVVTHWVVEDSCAKEAASEWVEIVSTAN